MIDSMIDIDIDIDSAFGNAEAFAGLRETFEHDHGKLYQAAFGILDEPEAALDAVQDVFLKALSNPSAFAGRSMWATYLYRAVVNRALDVIKSGKFKMSSKRSKSSSDPVVEREWTSHDVVPRGYPSPLQNLLTKEKILGTQVALEGLPTQQAQALLLAVSGSTMREVASQMGVPLGTALSRINAARNALKK